MGDDATKNQAGARRVVIAGGGVTGLTAAYRLLKLARDESAAGSRAAPITVTLLEARAELGGNIRTERKDGLVIDGGPDAFVVAKPQATALCKELGLGDRLIGTTARNRKVYILHGGRLHPLPEGMVLAIPSRILPMARTGLLSWRAKARMALDLVLPQSRDRGDEPLGHFIRRRLGREAAERIAEPLLGGIYAGDIDALSARSTFPQLVDLEERHGSLIRGVLAQRAAREAQSKGPQPSVFHSLVGGMGELTDALAAEVKRAGGDLRTGTKVERVLAYAHDPLTPVSAGDASGALTPRFLIEARGPSGELETIAAHDLILALPAYGAAHALRELDAEIAAMLREVPYESTATVILGYRRADVPHPLDAVGLIIPKAEGRRALAATFVSSKWDHRAPPDVALLRVFIGGHRDPRAIEQSDAALIDLAKDELCALIGVRADPLLARVFRYERGSAQPIVGHADRIRRVRERAALHPGLHLAGAAFDGVGIPDCVRQANEVAARIAGGR
jgi:oxygen-dependent protoporphyrinogen oxidase